MKYLLLFLFSVPLLLASNNSQPNLINGRPAQPGEYPEVVYISVGNSRCTATVVGERVLLTAAHCGTNGSAATFQIGQTLYRATLTRSSLYPGRDHDLSLGLIDKKVTGISFASIGGDAETGGEITLAGYGCISPEGGGSGGNDGVLRVGETTITGFTTYDMISSKQGGAALCFGDSGGPAFVLRNGQHFVLGVNSKGNIRDTNYNARTDLDESKTFFNDWAEKNQVDICGLQVDCNSGPNPSPSPTPSPDPTPDPTPQPGSCRDKFLELGECLGYTRF